MKLTIVSGLSGSGKSVALGALEDQGYFCIDNLPVGLLEHLIEEARTGPFTEQQNIAAGIDARSREADILAFPAYIKKISNAGILVETIFLRADENIILKRYNETRRRHPLTRHDRSLTEAVKLERELLSTIAEHADLVIDTSRTSIYDLRNTIHQRVNAPATPLSLQFTSFGYKHGLPQGADFVFDARCLPNPYWQPHLREYSGLDQPVIDYLEKQPEVTDFFSSIKEFLDTWIPHFIKQSRSYLTVAIGCTGGQHRSVFLAQKFSMAYQESQFHTSIKHSELS